MIKVSSTDLQRDIDHYQDIALRQPIAVTRGGEDTCVLLSTEEYNRLERRDREVLAIEDFTDADAESVRRADPGREAAVYDHELTPEA